MMLLYKIIMRIGRICNIYRIKYYKHFISGKDYRLNDEVIMSYPANIEIGSGSYINGGHIIASENAHIIIGENCLISYNVHIRTDSHNYIFCDQLINEQGHIEKDIIIGDDVWIGYGAQILPGVKIGNGCVIGAGAIVTKSTEPYGVYVGAPAKIIKYRINSTDYKSYDNKA